MITLKFKDTEDLKEKIGNKNLLIQCSFCPSWNFSKEEIEEFARGLNVELKKIPNLCNRPEINIEEEYDSILVLGCGAGIQVVSEALDTKVIPATDTTGIGVKNKKIEIYCKACGDCILDETAGICPITRCSKSLINGPCGGVNERMCEVNDIECGWILIMERMKELGQTDKFTQVRIPRLERKEKNDQKS